LECLWEIGYVDGNPVIGDETDVSLACEFPGDQKVITKALMDAGGEGRVGFIELTAQGQYQIHDLLVNAPKYVIKRAEAAQMRLTGELSEKRRLAALARWNKDLQCKTDASCIESDANACKRMQSPPRPAPPPLDLSTNPPAAVASGNGELKEKPKKEPTPRKLSTGPQADLVAHFVECWGSKYGTKYIFAAKDGVAASKILSGAGGDLAKAMRIIDSYLACDDPFIADQRHPLPLLRSQINRFTAAKSERYIDPPPFAPEQ
jgi:hypothetical protein